MTKRAFLITLALMIFISAYGQNERKVIRDGVRAYDEEEFGEAEVQFRRAENLNQESYEAEFNTGAALYGQEKYEETVKLYQSMLDRTDDVDSKAQIWHNIGNSLLEAQQYAPSIEAYKSSLRLKPTDNDTRYNLAYAKQKLKEEQEQNQQDKDQDQDQDKDQDQDQDKDQDKDQEQDKDKDQEQDKDKDQEQDKEQQDNENDQESQPEPREISKEDAERMLKAIQQQEKDVKEKVDKKKAAAAKVKTEKDW